MILVFAIIVLFFSAGGSSAQEVRSGWEIVDSSTDSDLLTAEFHEGEYWAFGRGGAMIRSLDGGYSWSESGISVNHDLTASDSNFGSMAVAGNGGTVLLMKDGVWMDISRPDILDGGVTDIALTGNNSFVVISGASIWTCIVYDGGGTDWDGRWGDSSAVLSSVSFLDTNNGLISGENGTILATNDGGQTWNYRDAPSDVSASEIVDVEYYSSIRAYAI